MNHPNMTPATPTIAAHVHVGTSPTGVVWNVFPKTGESEADFANRVDGQRARLAKLHADWSRRSVTVRKLSPNATHMIEDTASLFEGELKADYDAMVSGATFVKASRALLEAVVEDLKQSEDDRVQMAAEGVLVEGGHHIEFAERQARRSVRVTVRRIEDALKGFAPTKRVHVRGL